MGLLVEVVSIMEASDKEEPCVTTFTESSLSMEQNIHGNAYKYTPYKKL